MIPGTPLIATFKIKEAAVTVQTVVVFVRMKRRDVVVFDPRKKCIWQGSEVGLLNIDGRPFDKNSIIMTKWEELIPSDMVVTEDFCVIRGSADSNRTSINEYHIKEAIDKYNLFNKKKS